MNPARDIGTKAFAFIAGWGDVAFTGGRDIPYFNTAVCAGCRGCAGCVLAIANLIGRHFYRERHLWKRRRKRLLPHNKNFAVI